MIVTLNIETRLCLTFSSNQQPIHVHGREPDTKMVEIMNYSQTAICLRSRRLINVPPSGIRDYINDSLLSIYTNVTDDNEILMLHICVQTSIHEMGTSCCLETPGASSSGLD